MLTAAVKMKQNQNTIAALYHQYVIRIKFHDLFLLFHQSLKKLAVVERLFSHLGTRFRGRCPCGEVAIIGRFP